MIVLKFFNKSLLKGPPIHVSEDLLGDVMIIYSMQQDAVSVVPINVSC